MNKLTAILISLIMITIGILEVQYSKAGLPNSINATSPADTDLASAGASQIRNLKQFIEDFWGIPDQTSLTQGLGILNATTNQYTFSMGMAFSNTASFSTTVSSTKACASNYTRTTPNTCTRTAGGALSTVVFNTGCNAVDFVSKYGLPTTAKTFTLWMKASGSGTGTAGAYSAQPLLWYDAGCSSVAGGMQTQADQTLIYFYHPDTTSHLDGSITFPWKVFNNGHTTLYQTKTQNTVAGATLTVTAYDLYEYTD